MPQQIQTGELQAALAGFRGEISWAEPLCRHTSIRVGGPADVFVVPADLEDLRRVLRVSAQYGVAVLPLGGSNLIVRDGGIRGVVVRLSHFQDMTVQGSGLYAGAGVAMPRLAQAAMQAGLAGLEFSCGIPGTLGGAIAMNAGTRDGEMADIIESVTIMDARGDIRECPRSVLQFGYRYSCLPPGIILGARLKLDPAPRAEIEARMARSLTHRRKTQPLHLPNAGSIFKNPPGRSAGALIERLGLKGLRVGDAELSAQHANFIVNRGRATARDILELIRRIQETVREHAGIELELEVRVVGEDG